MANEITKPKTPIWKMILGMITFVVILSLFIFSFTMNIAPTLPEKIFDGNITVMDSNAMGRTLRKGALVAYKKVANYKTLATGDVIVFNRKDGQDIIEEIRYFKGIETTSFGDEFVIVSNILGQEESYKVAPDMIKGKAAKAVNGLGTAYIIFTNKYALMVYSIIMLMILLSPILFAKVDYSRQLARKLSAQQQRDAKKQARLDKKAERTGSNKMVFYDYRIESLSEKEKELDKISQIISTQKTVKRFKPAKLAIMLLVVAALVVYSVMLVFNYGDVRLQAVEFSYEDIDALPEGSDNFLKTVKTNALVEYDDIILNSSKLKQGDILLVKAREGDKSGYALRYFYYAQPVGDVMYYYTYGVQDANGAPVLDPVKLGSESILGVYRNHSNGLGEVYQFLLSDIMFVLLCLIAAFIMLMCMYYKINNRIVYLKPLSDKSRRLLLESERTVTVSSVSVSNSRKAAGGIVTFLALVLVIGVSLFATWQVFGCDFVKVTSSKSASPIGSYALVQNNKMKLKIGDQILVEDILTTSSEQANLVSSKYIVDIIGDYYVVGHKINEPDYVYINGNPVPKQVTADQIYGKQVFVLQKFDKVLARLAKTDMIVIYIAAPILIIMTIILANAWVGYERKRKGVVQNILGNTFVEHNADALEKRLRHASMVEKLKFCDDNARVAYNDIKNFVLQYRQTKVIWRNGKEIFTCKGRHILTLEVIDAKLYAFTSQNIQKFEGIFAEIKKQDIYKTKNLPVRILIEDDTDALEFNKIFEGEMVAMRVGKFKKYVPFNFANAYDNRGVITLNVLAQETNSTIS